MQRASNLLKQAVASVQAGGNPLGASDAYYAIRATQKVFSAAVPWQQEIMPDMYPVRTLVAAGG